MRPEPGSRLMEPHVQAFFDKATHTVTYLVSDPATRAAAYTGTARIVRPIVLSL